HLGSVSWRCSCQPRTAAEGGPECAAVVCRSRCVARMSTTSTPTSSGPSAACWTPNLAFENR
ncbi:MAG: hypothetical protein ABEJ00_02230, partial [Gemmatimonadota bacterium]